MATTAVAVGKIEMQVLDFIRDLQIFVNHNHFYEFFSFIVRISNKINIQLRKEEPIPEGWAFGEDGNVTTDAREGFETGLLLPLGGLEMTSGYKGNTNLFPK